MNTVLTLYPGQSSNGQQAFPALPGFAPPVSLCYSNELPICLLIPLQPHKYATYGIVPSTAPSSDDESEDTLPRATLNAPIEALQGLANAAAEAAAAPSSSTPRFDGHVPIISCSDLGCQCRVKKRKRAEPIPRNAFPHVVEKACSICGFFVHCMLNSSP
jgi:hypothetical protein